MATASDCASCEVRIDTFWLCTKDRSLSMLARNSISVRSATFDDRMKLSVVPSMIIIAIVASMSGPPKAMATRQ